MLPVVSRVMISSIVCDFCHCDCDAKQKPPLSRTLRSYPLRVCIHVHACILVFLIVALPSSRLGRLLLPVVLLCTFLGVAFIFGRWSWLVLLLLSCLWVVAFLFVGLFVCLWLGALLSCLCSVPPCSLLLFSLVQVGAQYVIIKACPSRVIRLKGH